MKDIHVFGIYLILAILAEKAKSAKIYEGESISSQSVPFPINQDSCNFHALFQYMFICGYKIPRLSSHSLIRSQPEIS